MALIGIASASTCDRDLDAIGRELVDAVVFDPDEARLALEAGQFDDLIWGIVYRSMEEEVLESLVSAGCDFIFFETYNAPATIISQPEVALIACLEAPVSRKTSAALRSLGVDGSWNLSGEVRLGGLEFEDLIGLNKIAASTGGVTLVNDEGGSSLATLTALRNAGVDGLGYFPVQPRAGDRVGSGCKTVAATQSPPFQEFAGSVSGIQPLIRNHLWALPSVCQTLH